MKKILLSVIALLGIVVTNAQNVNIPDANLKAYLIGNNSINTNGDTEIQVSEAQNWGGAINCQNLGITDMTGIEAFPQIGNIDCSFNDITNLDLSNSPGLLTVRCNSNPNLTTIDVTTATNLQTLYCQNTALASLDITNNVSLLDLKVNQTQISALNTSNNTMLEALSCGTNPNLTSLVLTNNTQLVTLYARFLPISSLDISALTNLETLWCDGNNSQTALDLSNNTSLKYVQCGYSTIANISLGNISNLEELYCEQTDISSLIINNDNGTSLEILRCTNSNLSDLSIGNAPHLQEIRANSIPLTSFTFGNMDSLSYLGMYNTQINSFDASGFPLLDFFDCSYTNNITYLNLANGNNVNISTIAVNNTPNLTCIQVDDSIFSANNWNVAGYSFDANDQFSLNCGTPPCIVTIPDANFKNYLVGNTLINTNGDTEIQCSEASSFNREIACFSQNISDLTGIEAFTALTSLKCGFNQLSTLDLTSNTSLTYIDCRDNLLNSIDVSTCLSLGDIRCNNNQLTNIGLSNNVALFNLACYNNNLSSLDLSNNLNLVSLGCYNNNILGSLDLSMHISLITFHARNNDLSTLNIANGNNVNMTTVVTEGNPNLSCIEVDDTAYSYANWASGNFQFDSLHVFSEDCSGSSIVLVSSITVQGQGGVSTITTQGGTLQMEATILPANADDMTYTWSVVNGTGAATIDATGLLTASADGTVDVIATANDASGTIGTKTIAISNQSVGIQDLAFEHLTIYPNPAKDLVNIRLENETLSSIKLLDVSGKMIVQFNRESQQLNVASIQAGLYFLELSNNEKQSVVKLTLQ